MIVFKKIKFKNFLSFGNHFTEIELDEHSSSIIMGKNGAGKSTFLDAITFALFGKAYRKINKPTLVNSINDKDCLVELYFNIGKKSYKIIRGIKPIIFEIYVDDVLLDPDKSKDYQDMLETSILKMNFKTFCQVVILGSATFTPFMQLTAAGRREIIESLLDIEIFSDMNVITKNKISVNKQNHEILKNKIETEKQKMVLIKKLLSNKKAKENVEDNTKETIEKLEKEIQNSIDENEKLIDQNKLLDQKLTSEAKFITLKDKLKIEFLEKTAESKTIDGKIKLYSNNKICPTCNQNFDNISHSHISDLEDEKKSLSLKLKEISDKIQKIDEQLNAFKAIKKIYSDNENRQYFLNSIIRENTKKIKELKVVDDTIKKQDDTDLSQEKELDLIKNQLEKYEKEKEILVSEKRYLDYCLTLLKDGGIKTKIIKQYLPIINKTVNNNLSIMNQNSNITFNLDVNFDEEIRSRGRDIFSYYNFSEGEKLRVDLALLLTWRVVAQAKNSVNTNILIMDEILDRSLDLDGVDGFLKVLNDLEKQGLNIFIISHKDNMTDKFKNIIRFEKTNNFSGIKEK